MRTRSLLILIITAVVTVSTDDALADHPVGIFGLGIGGPVVTPTADTLPAGARILGVSTEYRRFDTPSRGALLAQALAEDHVHSLRYLWSFSLTGAYGVSDRLTLAAAVPYVRRSDLQEAHVHGGAASVHEPGSSAGLGDLSVTGLWRFWDNGGGQAATLALGTFVPTGVTDERSAEGERLATEHQPGTGAWRPFLGVTYTRAGGALAWHANLRYTWATEGAQDTDLGDRVDFRAALVYRLGAAAEAQPHAHEPGAAEHRHDEGAGPRWDLLLELTGEYQRPERIAGIEEGGSERILYLAPGIRATGNSAWTAALSVGVPVSQDPGPGHVDTDWRVLATFSHLL